MTDPCTTPDCTGEARLRGRCLPCLTEHVDRLESRDLHTLARLLLERAAQVPPLERWRQMVDAGLIDEDGQVLIGRLP